MARKWTPPDRTSNAGKFLRVASDGQNVEWATVPSGYTNEDAQDAVGNILSDSSEINFTYDDGVPSITASLVAGSIDELKLDASVNASLDLADSALQSESDPIFTASQAFNIDAGDITNLSNLSGTNTGDQDLSGYQLLSEKGNANGYASLDSGGKVPVAQLPSSIMEYKGVWNASTNTPTLADGSGDTGDVYRVSVAGSQDLGSGSISFEVGDYVIYNGSVWEKSDTTDAVASVFGRTGVVTAQAGDYTKSDVGLGNVENTALSTWAGSSNLTTVGTLTGGATGAGFTIALGTSTLTGDLPFANLAQLTANSIAANATGSTADISALTIGANTFPARSSSGNMAAKTITDFGLSLVDDADAATARTTLGLVAGGTGDIWVEKAGDTMTGNLTISNTAPSLVLTDTTASAKGLTIAVDANIADLRESAGASGSLLALDLANNRVGIGTGSPNNTLSIAFSNATAGAVSATAITSYTNTDTTVGNSCVFAFRGLDTAGTSVSVAKVGVEYTSHTIGSVTGDLVFLAGANNAPSERMRASGSSGNIKIAGTAVRGTTEGTNHLDIFNGTAPAGTLSNGVSLYASGGKLFAMDSAGTATQLTP